MSDHSNDQLDLRSYLMPIWRRKWLVLALAVIAAAATYLISSSQHKVYTASTELYVQDADPVVDLTDLGAAGPPTGPALANVAQLLSARSVTAAVDRRLGALATGGSVTATPSSISSFITITASSPTAKGAAALANGYVQAYLASQRRAVAAAARSEVRASRASLASLPPSPLSASQQRQTILQQMAVYRQIALNPNPGATQVNPATVPALPSSPNPTRDAIFGLIAGLVLGMIAAFVMELVDLRIVSVSALEALFDRPVLAMLPRVRNPAPLQAGQRPLVPAEFVEALRSLTVMVRLSGGESPPRTLLVVSALPQEGKSTIIRALALVYAETGARVLVIDADLRRPSVERLFGVKPNYGLVQVLRGERSLEEAAVHAATTAQTGNGSAPPQGANGASAAANGNAAYATDGIAAVDLLCHGEEFGNAVALMSSPRMQHVLDQARERYDIVLIDTPPLLSVADATPLLERVDGVLVVVRLGKLTRHTASRLRQLLERLSDVNVCGVIANDQRKQPDGGYRGYSYGYSSGGSGRRGARSERTRAAAGADAPRD
jgi:Mrp family chromosome partitioning ATPase/capsular polysaccharide biosynthesis protein